MLHTEKRVTLKNWEEPGDEASLMVSLWVLMYKGSLVPRPSQLFNAPHRKLGGGGWGAGDEAGTRDQMEYKCACMA